MNEIPDLKYFLKEATGFYKELVTRNLSHINDPSYGTTTMIVESKIARENGIEIDIGLIRQRLLRGGG